MTHFIKRAMNLSRGFSLWEISFFKVYLLAFSLIIATLFPIILSLSVYFYLILFIVLDVLAVFSLVKREGNFLKKVFSWKKGYKIFKNYGIFDFWVFKTMVFSFWLLVAKVFPILLEVHLGFYTLIVWFWMGYFLASFLKQK